MCREVTVVVYVVGDVVVVEVMVVSRDDRRW